MINEIHISGYRGLRDLTVEPLGRVNLLVGMNNSGKTSILEAIDLVSQVGEPLVLKSICERRGEILTVPNSSSKILDPRHLFFGHTFPLDRPIHIQTDLNGIAGEVVIGFQPSATHGSAGAIGMEWHPPNLIVMVDLADTVDSLLVASYVGNSPWMTRSQNQKSLFIPSSGFSQMQTMHQLSDVMMTDQESLVLRALHTIDPTIQRIVPTPDSISAVGRFGGVLVNCKGKPPRLPIGMLGEGIWRMLGLALGLSYCQGGVLLIDDIDTGLHYTVMERMWKLIFEASKQLNVQVFATTHSRDCIDALASISREGVFEDSEVMIHRIEAGKSKSISYSEATIKAVAEFGNEVR